MIAVRCSIGDVSPQRATNTGSWRPQGFGQRGKAIADPLVEPLWIGERVLVRMAPADAITISDADGGTLTSSGPDDELASILAALPDALCAESAILDGYLTRQATQPPEGVVVDIAPQSSGRSFRRLFLGETRTRRAMELRDQERAAAERFAAAGSPLAFVAIDILELDAMPLLDVPLLERKRLLESALGDGELIRIGPFVRPPLGRWYLSWRAAGFQELVLKGANSRYRPGEVNDECTVAAIPRH